MLWKPEIDVDELPPGLAARLTPEAAGGIDLWNQACFVDLTQRTFTDQRHRARAAGHSVDYGLEDLRELVRHHLGERHAYCCRGHRPTRRDVCIRERRFRLPQPRSRLRTLRPGQGSLIASSSRVFDLLRSWSPRPPLFRPGCGRRAADFPFPRPNRTIRPIEDMTPAPLPEDERPGGAGMSPPSPSRGNWGAIPTPLIFLVPRLTWERDSANSASPSAWTSRFG